MLADLSSNITVVSGLPRSGTSLMMRLLEAAGLSVVSDQIRAADACNPLGYYEDSRVKRLRQDSCWLSSARGKAIKIISFLLPHLPLNENYNVIMMRRNLDEVVASQAAMLVQNGHPNDADDTLLRDIFKDHMHDVSAFVRNSLCFRVLELEYPTAFYAPQHVSDIIQTFLGRPLNTDAMQQVFDERLYRQRRVSRRLRVLP